MSHIFLITHEKCYGQKRFLWEDSYGNVTSYGNHNQAYTVKNLQNSFVYANGLADVTEILNQDMWSSDSQHTNETSVLNNRTGHL